MFSSGHSLLEDQTTSILTAASSPALRSSHNLPFALLHGPIRTDGSTEQTLRGGDPPLQGRTGLRTARIRSGTPPAANIRTEEELLLLVSLATPPAGPPYLIVKKQLRVGAGPE